MTKSGANSGNLVRRHRNSNPTATNEDPALRAPFPQSVANQDCKVRIVGRHSIVCAQIANIPLFFLQVVEDCFFQLEPSVVRSNYNLHATPLALVLLTISCAAAMIASAVKPNFFCSSFKGSEAPKVFIPIIRP